MVAAGGVKLVSMRVSQITDDGERMVPEFHRGTSVYLEHIARYLLASKLVKGKRVLDVASGVGYGSDMLKAAGASIVVGVDRSPEALLYGQDRHSQANPDYVVGDAESLPLRDRQFDVIVCFETIEHLDDPRRFLSEVRRLMHPKGLFIVSTPNRGIYPEGNPYHTNEFTLEEFEREMGGCFRNVSLLGQDNWLVSGILSTSIMASTDAQLEDAAQLYKAAGKPASETLYVIALCSDGPLPNVGESLVLGDICEVHEYGKQIARLSEDIQRLTAAIDQRETMLVEKSAALAAREEEFAEAVARLAGHEALLQGQSVAIEALNVELQSIRGSIGYRALSRYRRVIRWAFPERSWRGVPYRMMVGAMRRVIRRG